MPNQQARAARDAGICQAVQHAEDVHENWAAHARAVLEQFVGSKRRSKVHTFTAEEVRNSILALQLPKPPHARAWGGVFQSASKDGLIEKAGIAQMQDPACHCAYVALWRPA